MNEIETPYYTHFRETSRYLHVRDTNTSNVNDAQFSVSKIPLITAEFNLASPLPPSPSLPSPLLLSMTVIRA